MPARNPMAWSTGYATRPPGRTRRGLTVLIGAGMTVALWERRGPVAGLVALAIYGVAFSVGAFRFEQTRTWARRHPTLDRLLSAPLLFLALAYLSHLSLIACASIAVAATAVLLLAVMRVSRRR